MPLGESDSASVFLVKCDGPPFRLLRLKTWQRPAPARFLERFGELRRRLEAWADEGVASHVAATVDATGCPAVLSEFRQGLPLLTCVRSGRITPEAAMTRLMALQALAGRAHARGLIHGSVVPGNVILHPGEGAVYLLDFGLASLVRSSDDEAPSAAADLAGFAALASALTGSLPGETSRRL
ncbi:MAG: hypothetical protein ABIX28_19520 [Vicinamibacterales bacterium]